MQAAGKLERAERALVGRVDLLRVDVVEELLDVERVSLRAADDELERGTARPSRSSPSSCASFAARQLGHLARRRASVERQLLDLRAAAPGRAPAAARPRGGRRARAARARRRDGARDDVEQVARERVEPVAVLEHEHERLGRGARAQAVGEQVLERGLAQLGVERARQLGVGDRQAEHRVEQRGARDERRVDCAQGLLERREPARRPAASSGTPSRVRQISRQTK